MPLNTHHFFHSIERLQRSLDYLVQTKQESLDYEVYSYAVIKGFELALEIAGKLLRKTLKLYTGSPKSIDALTYKEVFRKAAQHDLIDKDALLRWFAYRDNRNNTAHDYGEEFVQETLSLMPNFLQDASTLEKILAEKLRS